MASLLTTTTTLTIPGAALEAVENLRRAVFSLNAADVPFAVSMGAGSGTAYDLATAALVATLEVMVADHPQASAVANYIHNESISNGESIEYQITHVIGWALRLDNGGSFQHVAPSLSPYLPANHDFS